QYAGGKLQRPHWAGVAGPCLALVTREAVKVGGVGLALVMLSEYGRAAATFGLPTDILPLPLEETVSGLQAYALAQIEGADLLHKRRFADGGVLPFRSDYYTGEALLGLIVTGCTEPAMIALTEGLMTRGYGIPEQSHWMAYAACEAAARGLADEALLRRYLSRLMSEIVDNPGYRDRRASTPIACRTEALTRYLCLADARPELCDAGVLASCHRTALENLVIQLEWYDRGQFWKGDEERKVQIDYIQHNATAFLNLWQHEVARMPHRGN
ncbi:MAG: hypothetical protein HC844_03500, partial [Tabrizicola sp.]|nr:hypothetical protein [Tabrizicola sp.]